MKLIYIKKAIEDLNSLSAFIAAHNPSAAARIAAVLVGKIKLLPNFLGLGTSVGMAPIPKSLQDKVFGNCIIRYSVHANAIIILQVWHQLESKRL